MINHATPIAPAPYTTRIVLRRHLLLGGLHHRIRNNVDRLLNMERLDQGLLLRLRYLNGRDGYRRYWNWWHWHRGLVNRLHIVIVLIRLHPPRMRIIS